MGTSIDQVRRRKVAQATLLLAACLPVMALAAGPAARKSANTADTQYIERGRYLV